MSEQELRMRLRAVARVLDTNAPAFDPASLRETSLRGARRRRTVVIAVVVALAGTAVAPTAFSALGDLFDVDRVPTLGPVPADVAPAFGGRRVELSEAQHTVSFPVRTLPSLGGPEAAFVRDDIVGGMVTVAYPNGTRLTQWALADVDARATVVPSSGTAEEAMVGRSRALWIAGTARGTFTVTGADGAVHKELFDLAAGALLWRDSGVAFLLQGAGSKENAVQLAEEVAPR